MSVNVSAADLRDESIVTVVAEALLAHQLPPDVAHPRHHGGGDDR